MKKPSQEASDTLPIKPLIEQLTLVRRTFRDILRHYGTEVEKEITSVGEKVTLEAEKKITRERVHEMRDVLMVLREMNVNPQKGRRRDLKRIETLLKDVGEIVSRWK